MSKYQFSFDVSENKMSNKDYNLLVVGGINLWGEWNTASKKKFMSKKDLRTMMKNTCHINKNKVSRVIKVLTELNILVEYEDYYFLNDVNGTYIQLYPETVEYIMEVLSENTFKIYCYLKNKYDIHVRYGFKENYFFSHTELLRMMGYAKSAANVKKIKWHLGELEANGLIEYNHNLVGRPGHHGLYMELYEVHNVSNVQKLVRKEMIEQAEELSGVGEISQKEKFMLKLKSTNDADVLWELYDQLPHGKRTQDEVNIIDLNSLKTFLYEEIERLL